MFSVRPVSGEPVAETLRRRTAVHEAAHAVAAVILGAQVAWVDLDWRPFTGATLHRAVDPHTDAVIAMAGYEATDRRGPRIAVDTHDTIGARHLVGEQGLAAAAESALLILAAHRRQLDVVAEALLDCGRLDGGQVVNLVRRT